MCVIYEKRRSVWGEPASIGTGAGGADGWAVSDCSFPVRRGLLSPADS